MNLKSNRHLQNQHLQRELYNKHYKRLYHVCLRILADKFDAELAMHDSFLKIFELSDNLDKVRNFYAWSKMIAINKAIDMLRKRKNKPVFESIDDNAHYLDYQDEAIPSSVTVEQIKASLNSLPDGYRIVLSLRLFENLDFSEIAKILNIKEVSVRSQYIRGRKKILSLWTR